MKLSKVLKWKATFKGDPLLLFNVPRVRALITNLMFLSLMKPAPNHQNSNLIKNFPTENWCKLKIMLINDKTHLILN